MSREIKFRLWAETDDGNKLLYLDLGEFDNGLWFNTPEHVDEHLSLMQYTGKKDKFEKEIYEGDILKQPNGFIWKVYYSDELASFRLVRNGQKNEPAQVTVSMYDLQGICEVIGNIFENTKLL